MNKPIKNFTYVVYATERNDMKNSCIPTKIFGADFTLTIGCKLNCHYCPQQKFIDRYVSLYGKDALVMTFDTFKICLSKVEHGSGINFGGMSEPFGNKDCSRMIKYAYDLGYKISINTTLVDATEEDLELLNDVKFEYVKLHIPDQAGHSKFLITDEYINIFRKFSERFIINTYSCHSEVHDSIRKYIKEGVRIASTMMNRAGNLEYEELPKYDHKGKIACGCGDTDPGWKPVILPNGAVILCGMDYGMQHILGNLLEQDWDEILQGNEFMMIEKGYEDEKLPCLCRKCHAAMPSNDQRLEESRLLGPNAIRIARVIEDYRNNKYGGGGMSRAFRTGYQCC